MKFEPKTMDRISRITEEVKKEINNKYVKLPEKTSREILNQITREGFLHRQLSDKEQNQKQ